MVERWTPNTLETQDNSAQLGAANTSLVCDNHGIVKKSIEWFRNYLTDRTQCVIAEGYCSESLTIKKGFPQGSILAPALFTIFINDLGKDKQAKLHLYVDETVVYSEGPSIEVATQNYK
ncbi:hypothetical protein WMY93_030978 [Mugilogobius chulae]|uniref:Reverse transcriptase domain-containing protein n=1 Tax=Mugilogobius chulae TaxID=88201 RepID=A0AAW0MPL8_9GOBI